MPPSDTEAARFVAAILNIKRFYQTFEAQLIPHKAPPSVEAVNNWMRAEGYRTDLNSVISVLTTMRDNDVGFWVTEYNTQFVADGCPGPLITIGKNNTVAVDSTVINGATINSGILSWTDQSNLSNAQLELSCLTGISPCLDPLSPSFSTSPALYNAQSANPGVPNAYIGAQFQGFYWAQGQSKPPSANIWGRRGKFPPSSAPQGNLQASTLAQWADSYQVWTPSENGDGTYQESVNTLTIDPTGNVSVNDTAIISPTFVNEVLQWSSDSGNLSSGQLYMRDNTSNSSTGSIGINQFWRYFWGDGVSKPSTANWLGFSKSGNGGTSSGDRNSSQAFQDLNEWATILALVSQSINTYVLMQMGQMIVENGFKLLGVHWDDLKKVFAQVGDWVNDLKENASGAGKIRD